MPSFISITIVSEQSSESVRNQTLFSVHVTVSNVPVTLYPAAFLPQAGIALQVLKSL